MNRKKKENFFRRTNFSFKGKFSFITKKKKKKQTNKQTNIFFLKEQTFII